MAVTPVTDTEFEGTETVTLSLAPLAGATPGELAAHTVTLLDDEARPVATFAAATASGVEGQQVQVPITLSDARDIPVSVTWSAVGLEEGEFLAPQEITFAPGSLQATLPLDPCSTGSTTPPSSSSSAWWRRTRRLSMRWPPSRWPSTMPMASRAWSSRPSRAVRSRAASVAVTATLDRPSTGVVTATYQPVPGRLRRWGRTSSIRLGDS